MKSGLLKTSVGASFPRRSTIYLGSSYATITSFERKLEGLLNDELCVASKSLLRRWKSIRKIRLIALKPQPCAIPSDCLR